MTGGDTHLISAPLVLPGKTSVFFARNVLGIIEAVDIAVTNEGVFESILIYGMELANL